MRSSCPLSMRVALSEDGSPMRMRASRVESWLGFSRRSAFCVAARAVGDGGLGAGFIACATVSGMVGMLTEDTTGSVKACGHWRQSQGRRVWERTRVVSADGGLHDGLHPLTYDALIFGTKIVRLICLVNDPESITSRVNILVRNDLVADDIDISLDLRFLHQNCQQVNIPLPTCDSPPCCSSAKYTNVVP